MDVLSGERPAQDVRNLFVRIYLLILVVCGPLFARVIHVPAQFETIQGGLDALSANDTLVVALGTYEEALISQAIPFTLLGESDSTSSLWSGPHLEASGLDLPNTAAALLLTRFSDVRIENFKFSNAHRYGIKSWADNLTLVNCRMDSAYEWIVQEQDSIGAVILLKNCVFQNAELTGILVRYGNQLRASGCQFSGGEYHDPRSLINVSSSEIDSCNFTDEYGHGLLYTVRGPHMVTNCTFGPALTRPFESAVSISDTMPTFVNNTIIDCLYGHRAVRIVAIYPDYARISGNTFIRCIGMDVGLSAAGALGIQYSTWPTGQGAVVSENTFINCAGYVTSNDVWPFVGFPALIENNHFIRDGLNGLPSIGGSGSPWQEMPHTTRNNIFVNCGYALDGSILTDARYNYWGDPTGPYHEFDNPQGLGDTLTGFAQFIPWLTDTTSAAHEAPPQIADKFSLTAYPNPFNPTTRISFTLTKPSSVELSVYDILGREQITLLDERMTAGTHNIQFDGTSLPSGVYFARLQTDSRTSITKLVLLK